MTDFLDCFYKTRARTVTVTPTGGGAAFSARMLLEDHQAMAWADANPAGKFQKPIELHMGDRIALADTGAEFEVALTVDKPLTAELEVDLKRIADAFDGLTDPSLYRTREAKAATLNGQTISVLLERVESARGLDYGRARRILCARTPAATLNAEPKRNDTLTVTAYGSTSNFLVYDVEALYRQGEYRLILERG